MKMIRLSMLAVIGSFLISCGNNETSNNEVNGTDSTQVENTAGDKEANAINGTFQIDTINSQVKWTGKKIGGEHMGTLGIQSGNITIEAGQIKSGVLTFNMDAITVTDIEDEEDNGNLVKHLKNDDFFSTEKFPTAVLSISDPSKTTDEADLQQITSKLTIKGIEQEVTFPGKIIKNEEGFRFHGVVEIDRTLWDIKYKSSTFFPDLGDRVIHDKIPVEFDVQLNPQALEG